MYCWWVAICFVQAAQAQSFTLHFMDRAGREPLLLENTYRNAFGETFTVRNFRYYISHIQLVDSTGRLYETRDSCYLVDAADSASHYVTVQASGPVKTLRFLLGVDSSKNASGVQSGALDPAKGMFWTWNSGYIMAKLEGKSPASTAPGQNFTYHIGGYRPGQETARWITLPLDSTSSGNLVTIAANILQWFSGKAAITIAVHPVCHEPGPLAVQLADNYATMFTVVSTGGEMP